MFVRLNVMRKARTTPRLLAFLLDGDTHSMGEFYDFVAEGIEPPSAVQKFILNVGGGQTHRREKGKEARREFAALQPEAAIAEGRRIGVLEIVKRLETDGIVSVEWPERELRISRSRGFTDTKKVKIRFTEDGLTKLFTSNGTMSKIIGEMILNLQRGEIEISVFPAKKRIPEGGNDALLQTMQG